MRVAAAVLKETCRLERRARSAPGLAQRTGRAHGARRRDQQREVDTGAGDLVAPHEQVMRRELVPEQHQQSWLEAVVVGGTLGGIAAQLGSEAGAITAGCTARRSRRQGCARSSRCGIAKASGRTECSRSRWGKYPGQWRWPLTRNTSSNG